MHCVTVFVDVLHSIAYNCVHCGVFQLNITVFDVFVLFISCKNCITTSESKGRLFLQNESIRIDTHNESNRIDSNRELECSTLLTIFRIYKLYLLTYLFE